MQPPVGFLSVNTSDSVSNYRGNNNRLLATTATPSGSTVIQFRFRQLNTRDLSHFSFLVELGFSFVGQFGRQMAVTDSACDPHYAASVGRESINQAFRSPLSNYAMTAIISFVSFFIISPMGLLDCLF
jgi:hypothetical protein